MAPTPSKRMEKSLNPFNPDGKPLVVDAVMHLDDNLNKEDIGIKKSENALVKRLEKMEKVRRTT